MRRPVSGQGRIDEKTREKKKPLGKGAAHACDSMRSGKSILTQACASFQLRNDIIQCIGIIAGYIVGVVVMVQFLGVWSLVGTAVVLAVLDKKK